MEASARLDYVLFQLTPTRTRCDLVIFSGKLNEKLAYGLFEPFVSHLRSAKDEIAKGGYSITLRPPATAGNASWFTKSTLQRFVRFVSTPEVLERVATIEREIQQIENSIQSYEVSNEGDANGHDDNFKSVTSVKFKGEPNRNTDGTQQENSKARLQRVLDTRKAVLCKEQAMAYARALAAGYEMNNLDDLLSFSDAFGAFRLRDACISFIDLWKKKNEDRLWLDEIAAMQALPQPGNLSYLGTSGIVLAGEDDIQGGGFSNGKPYEAVEISASDSNGSHGSSDQQSVEGKAQVPFPWANQLQYMHNFQGFQPMAPYQGYFPGMQVPPQYYPNNTQWPPNVNNDGYQVRKSSTKKKDRRSEKVEQSGDTEPSGSSTNSDSSTEYRQKKHGKRSSRKVVIRNINYINSRKNGEKASSSEESSTDEDAVGSLEKHHRTDVRRRENGTKQNGGSDNEDGLLKDVKGEKGSENWDAFQQLLMREDMDSNDPHGTKVLEQDSVGLKNKAYGTRKQGSIASDAFVVSERDMGNGSILGESHIQNFEAGESMRALSGKGNAPEEFLMSQRTEETDHYSRAIPSDSAFGSSTIKGRGGDDWIISKTSTDTTNQSTSFDLGSIDGKYAPSHAQDGKSKKDIVDDSLMVQARSADDHVGDHLRFGIDMVSDSVGKASSAQVDQHGKSMRTGVHEPEELLMVLDRDSTPVDYPAHSWTPEMDHENNIILTEASKRQSDVDACDDTVIASNGKDGKKKGRPISARDAKSRSLSGLPGRSKAELASKNSRPPWGSRASANKSKLEKEEEARKRKEELLLQRQKRIAERSAVNPSSLKKTPTLSRAKSTSFEEKPKVASPNEETKKVRKPVLKSSTFDRLAAAKTVQKETATPSKSSQPKREASRVNSGSAAKPSQKPKASEGKKPSLNKRKPSDKKPESGDLSVLRRSSSDVNKPKVSNDMPEKSPPELATAEETHISAVVNDREVIKALPKIEEKPALQTDMASEKRSNGHPIAGDLPKPAADHEIPHRKIEDDEPVRIDPPHTEASSGSVLHHPVPEMPIRQLTAAVVDVKGSGSTNNSAPTYREIEESTPPTRELVPDLTTSRKKWNNVEDSRKAPKGLKKLLMFGRRRIEYA